MPRSRFRRLCAARDRQPSVGARAGGARRRIPGSRARTRPRLFARGIARVVEPFELLRPSVSKTECRPLAAGIESSQCSWKGEMCSDFRQRYDLARVVPRRLGSCGTAGLNRDFLQCCASWGASACRRARPGRRVRSAPGRPHSTVSLELVVEEWARAGDREDRRCEEKPVGDALPEAAVELHLPGIRHNVDEHEERADREREAGVQQR